MDFDPQKDRASIVFCVFIFFPEHDFADRRPQPFPEIFDDGNQFAELLAGGAANWFYNYGGGRVKGVETGFSGI